MRLPGSGSFQYFGGLLGYVVQTPWIAYIFLVLLVYCLLSSFLEQRKLLGYVKITIGACIPMVIVFRNAQGHGWEYGMIWVFGLTGCFVYWLERMIEKTPGNIR